MTCLHNHDQILEFLRKIYLKGFQIYQNYLCALMLQPIQFMFLMHILFSGLYNKSACLQVSTRGQGQRSININVFTVILTTRLSNTTRFADDHFGLCPFFFFFHCSLFDNLFAPTTPFFSRRWLCDTRGSDPPPPLDVLLKLLFSASIVYHVAYRLWKQIIGMLDMVRL